MSPLFLNSVSVIIVLWQEFENSLGLSFEASFHAFNKLSLRKSYSFFALRTYIIIIEEEIMVDNCGRRILSHVWKPIMSIGKSTGSNARTEHVISCCHKWLLSFTVTKTPGNDLKLEWGINLRYWEGFVANTKKVRKADMYR